MSNIKNIIFDFGGVFIDIDYNATRKAFLNLGIKNFDNLFKQDYVSNLFEDLETGKINEQDFYFQFNSITKSQLTKEQIKRAWNAMLGNFWMERLEFAKTLKASYKVLLLSNTNEIHFKSFDKSFKKKFPTNNFSNYFHQVYYSHEVGMRKPNADCYLRILKDHQLSANETLFVDDTLKNIEGAQKVALQILHLKPHMDLTESVSRILKFPYE